MKMIPHETHHDPRDEIRIGLLCPAQKYKGICTQKACGAQGFLNGGTCVLDGAAWASFCVIPQSHPVKEIWRELADAQAEARKHVH